MEIKGVLRLKGNGDTFLLVVEGKGTIPGLLVYRDPSDLIIGYSHSFGFKMISMGLPCLVSVVAQVPGICLGILHCPGSL